jgi:gamma-glutamyltranspeptidase / glutathione hydrolase
MVVLYYDAHTGKVYSLNAGYNVPLKENDPLSIPSTGGRTVLVPGFMAGVQALHDRFGKLPFQRLFEPSITLAENGEPVYGLLGWQIQARKAALGGFPETKKVFTTEDGRFYGIHWFGGADIFRQPALAETLENVATNGASYMYEGTWAQKFIKTVQDAGGNISLQDMKDYHVIWDEPLESTFRDYEVYTLGRSSEGGVGAILGLNLLELANLKTLGYWTNSPESLFWFNQIMSACETVLYFPPIINGKPLTPEQCLKKETAAWIWSQMQAGKWPSLTNSAVADAGKGHHSAAIVAVDRWGNVALVIHSINSANLWGTGMFMDGVSIPDSGALQREVLKQVGPGNRLFTTPSPLLFFRGRKPVLACGGIGADGGAKMMQVLESILDFNLSLPAAEKAPAFLMPLWRHDHRLTAQFARRTFGPEVLDGLRAMGMQSEVPHDPPMGFWVGIQINPANGYLNGAVSRGDSEQIEGY